MLRQATLISLSGGSSRRIKNKNRIKNKKRIDNFGQKR
jgi:hypothetical protein